MATSLTNTGITFPDTTNQTTAAVSVPSGSLFMWPTASAPSGYLLCNGTAVSRTTYSALFAVVGTTFGAGDGSTTFNLPDYRDRMPVGAGTSYSANSKGGSKNAIVVSHTHTATVSDPGHAHIYRRYASPPGYQGGTYGYNQGYSSVNTDTSYTGISVSNSTTGSSGTNANMPPYIGIYFIIKT